MNTNVTVLRCVEASGHHPAGITLPAPTSQLTRVTGKGGEDLKRKAAAFLSPSGDPAHPGLLTEH